MKKIKNLLCFAALLALAATLVACKSTLDSTGVYANGAAFNSTNAPSASAGMTLYNADLAIVTAYNTLDGFVSWEKQNQAILAQWPQIHQTANNIRTNAPKWIHSAVVARDAYQSSASSTNATALTTTLSVLSAAVSQATTYVTAYTSVAPTNSLAPAPLTPNNAGLQHSNIPIPNIYDDKNSFGSPGLDGHGDGR